jgi:uncharacterized membrane protein YdbT with pleckstrin-like domain
MAEETSLWKGRTSQLVHTWFYLIWLLITGGIIAGAAFNPLVLIALVVPAFSIVGRWLVTRATVYELTTQRLRKTTGILNKKLDELELYRVKDSTLEQPLLLRIFGLGNIAVVSSDASLPTLVMEAVPGAYQAREKLRLAVEAERDRKRVRDVEFTEADSDNAPH